MYFDFMCQGDHEVILFLKWRTKKYFTSGHMTSKYCSFGNTKGITKYQGNTKGIKEANYQYYYPHFRLWN